MKTENISANKALERLMEGNQKYLVGTHLAVMCRKAFVNKQVNSVKSRMR